MRSALLAALLLATSGFSQEITGLVGTTSNTKLVAARIGVPIGGIFGVTGGLAGISTSNFLVFSEYTLGVETSIYARASVGNVVFQIAQGASYFQKAVAASRHQFPTEISMGIQNSPYTLGLFWKHYSNGGANNGAKQEFVGFFLGWAL